MRITLDSNVFTDDFRMQKTHFELLRRYLRIAENPELITCRITVDDVLNQFYERLLFETTRAVRGTLNINTLTGYQFDKERVGFVAEETERFTTFFENKLKELQISVIQYRELKHSSIVKRCLQRRSMLKDLAFKHIFSWEAVLQQVLEEGKQTVAITDQASKLITSEEPVIFDSALFDCSAHNRFIRHLIPDLPAWRRIELFPTLFDFLHKHLLPMLSLEYDKLDLLNENSSISGFMTHLEHWVQNNTQLLIVELERQLDKIFHPGAITSYNHTLRIHAIDTTPSSTTFMDVYRLDDQTLYWPIRVALYIVMSFDADPEASTTIKNLDPTESRISAQFSSDWFCHVFSKLELPIQLAFIWDTQTNTATHQQITFLPIQKLDAVSDDISNNLNPETFSASRTVWP